MFDDITSLQKSLLCYLLDINIKNLCVKIFVLINKKCFSGSLKAETKWIGTADKDIVSPHDTNSDVSDYDLQMNLIQSTKENKQ